MESQTKLYIHLGLPKTGTTYLQRTVFSQLPEVLFLEKAVNVSIWDLLASSENKILISSEHLLANPFKVYEQGWLSTFKSNLERLHQLFPNTNYILTLRKHSSLFLSYYKEHISKGGRVNYPDLDVFFNIENNKGHIKWEDLYFSEIIESVVSKGNRLLILFQEDLKENSEEVFQQLLSFMKLPHKTFNDNKNRVVNVGVYKKQSHWLIRMNKFNQQLNKLGLDWYHPFLRKIGMTPDYIARKRMKWMGKEPIALSPEIEVFMDRHYEEDWKYALDYKHKLTSVY